MSVEILERPNIFPEEEIRPTIEDFMESIVAYHDAVARYTGEANPHIETAELFNQTEASNHRTLITALWTLDSGDWSVRWETDPASEKAVFVLYRAPAQWHYQQDTAIIPVSGKNKTKNC